MPTYSEYRSTLTPVATWPLNGSGADIAGGGLDLSPSAALTYVQGCRDGTLAWQGDGAKYLSRAAGAAIGGLLNLSVEAWVASSAGVTIRSFVSCGVPGSTGWNFNTAAQSVFNFVKNGVAAVDPSLRLVRDLAWIHLIVTVDADNKVRTYANGVLWNVGTNTGELRSAAASSLMVGADTPATPANFMLAGDLLQDVSIYNRALTLTEIKNLYTYGCQGTTTTTLGTDGFNAREAIVLTSGRSHPDSWVKSILGHTAIVNAVGASGSVRVTDSTGNILPATLAIGTGLLTVKASLGGQEYATGKNCYIYGRSTADTLPYRGWGTPMPAYAYSAVAAAAQIMPNVTVTTDGTNGGIASGAEWWHPGVVRPEAGHWTAKATDGAADTITHVMVNTPIPAAAGANKSHYENPHLLTSANGGASFTLVAGITQPIDPWPGGTGFNSDPSLIYQHGGAELWCYYREVAASTRIMRRKLSGASWASVAVGDEEVCTVEGTLAPVAPSVVYDTAAGVYRMFAAGQEATNNQASAVYMWSSTDGLTWTGRTRLFGPDKELSGATRTYGAWHGSVIWHPASGYWYACHSETAFAAGPTGGPSRMWRCRTLAGTWEPMRATLFPAYIFNYMHSLVVEADGSLCLYHSTVSGGASVGCYRVPLNVDTMHPLPMAVAFGYGYGETATGETATYYSYAPLSNADTTWSLSADIAAQLATDQAAAASELLAQKTQIRGTVTVNGQAQAGTIIHNIGADGE